MYNNRLFSFRLELFIIFIASLLLIETIATSLKFIAFCIKSWQLLQRYSSYLKSLSKKYH